MDIPCTVCHAPLHVWEYVKHLKSCIIIKVHTDPLRSAHEVFAEDQRLAHARETARR